MLNPSPSLAKISKLWLNSPILNTKLCIFYALANVLSEKYYTNYIGIIPQKQGLKNTKFCFKLFFAKEFICCYLKLTEIQNNFFHQILIYWSV